MKSTIAVSVCLLLLGTAANSFAAAEPPVQSTTVSSSSDMEKASPVKADDTKDSVTSATTDQPTELTDQEMSAVTGEHGSPTGLFSPYQWLTGMYLPLFASRGGHLHYVHGAWEIYTTR